LGSKFLSTKHPTKKNDAAYFAVTTEGPITKDVYQILLKVDNVFSKGFQGHVKRRLFCKSCLIEGKAGYFDIEEGIQLFSDGRKCSKKEHKPDKDVIQMINDSNKKEHVALDSLIDKDKNSLKLEVFESSMIRTEILENQMVRGEQLWVYHDGGTDPSNIMARKKIYAHVLIYVEPRQVEGKTQHEVVHVKKDNLGGLMKATIARENVLDAIKPHNHVFLGHKIDTCQFAGNVRDQIAKRALACVDTNKGKIVFNYDNRCLLLLHICADFVSQVQLRDVCQWSDVPSAHFNPVRPYQVLGQNHVPLHQRSEVPDVLPLPLHLLPQGQDPGRAAD